MSLSRRNLIGAAHAIVAAPAVLRAQSGFPDRPVTFIVSAAAGGPTDAIGRLLGEAMSRDLGQPVVIVNVSGATLGPQRGATAKPDGYTFMIGNVGFAASATLYRQLPYDVLKSFAPLGIVTEAAMTVVTRKDFPAADLAQLFAVMKAEGSKLNLANSGLGSASHLGGMLLQQAAGATATTIPFRGSAPAMVELLAGRIDLFVDQATNTVGHIRSGAVKGFAVTSERRVPGLEQLPTAAELGHPTLAMSTWHGLYSPQGTPEPAQERLAAAARTALRDATVRRRFADIVTEPAAEERATPAYHRRFLAEEVARWKPLIVAAGVYAD